MHAQYWFIVRTIYLYESNSVIVFCQFILGALVALSSVCTLDCTQFHLSAGIIGRMHQSLHRLQS